jgi:hypothetical protein
VLANVHGQIGATAWTQVRPVLVEVSGEFVLPKVVAARNALRDGVIPTELEEQCALVVIQGARPPAVEMDDLVTVERNGIVGRYQPPASLTRQLQQFCITFGARHDSAPRSRINNLLDQLTQDQRPRNFAATFLMREKKRPRCGATEGACVYRPFDAGRRRGRGSRL